MPTMCWCQGGSSSCGPTWALPHPAPMPKHAGWVTTNAQAHCAAHRLQGCTPPPPRQQRCTCGSAGGDGAQTAAVCFTGKACCVPALQQLQAATLKQDHLSRGVQGSQRSLATGLALRAIRGRWRRRRRWEGGIMIAAASALVGISHHRRCRCALSVRLSAAALAAPQGPTALLAGVRLWPPHIAMDARSVLLTERAAAAPAHRRQTSAAPLGKRTAGPRALQSTISGSNVRHAAVRQARRATRPALAAAAAGPEAAPQQESQLQPFLRWAIANGAWEGAVDLRTCCPSG